MAEASVDSSLTKEEEILSFYMQRLCDVNLKHVTISNFFCLLECYAAKLVLMKDRDLTEKKKYSATRSYAACRLLLWEEEQKEAYTKPDVHPSPVVCYRCFKS